MEDQVILNQNYSMILGGLEFLIFLFFGFTGILLSLRRKYYEAERIRESTIHLKFLGLSLIILVSGLVTPADLFSNIILSVPLFLLLLYILKKKKRHTLNEK